MKFDEISLYSTHLEQQKKFYTERLGFSLISETPNAFAIQAGRTLLRFTERADAKPYHFAFNIPCWQEEEALQWLKASVEVLPFEGKEIVDFSNWNATAIYFYDADHNIVELIARKNLNHASVSPFGKEAILEVSEMGLPVDSIKRVYQFLNEEFQLPIFSGNLDLFCAIGGEQGLFIVIDKNKKAWFPKGDQAESADFEITIDLKGQKHKLLFEGGELMIVEADKKH